jgi:hypothetical protein
MKRSIQLRIPIESKKPIELFGEPDTKLTRRGDVREFCCSKTNVGHVREDQSNNVEHRTKEIHFNAK